MVVVVATLLTVGCACSAGSSRRDPVRSSSASGHTPAASSAPMSPSLPPPVPARSGPVPTASTPGAERNRYATVGPLFPTRGTAAEHFCTASVIASPTRDTIITAAHCVGATGVGMKFVPGYHLGKAPYGIWQVTGAYLPAAWLDDHDPTADYAILTVAPHHSVEGDIQVADVAGSELLGHAPAPGMVITAIAYNRGVKDDPVTCDARVFEHEGYPTFDCHGFSGGSSGSPWLTWDADSGRWTLHGVIGGLHQGGCFEYRSHTSAFTTDVDALLDRASSHAPPDTVVGHGDRGC